MQLITELALFEKAPEELITSKQTLIKYGFSVNPLFFSWVAEYEGVVVGTAICYIRYSTWKGPVLYLEDLVVTKSMRRKGVGKRLFDACLEYARLHHYCRIAWQVLDWNTSAIQFYEKYNAEFSGEWVNGYIDL
ncbi:MAG: GNAT family N-acetyltransferase [Flavobacteriales bacterium]|nr:MAG: GNAT family N-acetyltransferase [Flavobacteriales bacterium]